jgi:hypothetical protein
LQPWSLLLISSPQRARKFAGGLLAGVLALAQPMFLPGWFMWAAFLLWKKRPVADAAAVLGGCVVGAGTVRWAWPVESSYWSPQILTRPTLDSIAGGAGGIFQMLTGVETSMDGFDSPVLNSYLFVVAALTVLVLLLAIFKWRREGPGWGSLPQASGLAALGASLLLWPFLDEAWPRYFLPAATHLAIVAGLGWRHWPMRAWMAASAVGVLGLGGLPWERAQLSDADELAAVVRLLRRARVEGVYSTSPLLQWQIMYYSQDTVPARWVHPSDRIPEYPQRVDHALWTGRTTALVGFAVDGLAARALPGFFAPSPRYFVLLRPQPNLLEASGFKLNPPSESAR